MVVKCGTFLLLISLIDVGGIVNNRTSFHRVLKSPQYQYLMKVCIINTFVPVLKTIYQKMFFYIQLFLLCGIKKKALIRKQHLFTVRKLQIDPTQFSFYAMPPQFLKTVSFPKEIQYLYSNMRSCYETFFVYRKICKTYIALEKE